MVGSSSESLPSPVVGGLVVFVKLAVIVRPSLILALKIL